MSPKISSNLPRFKSVLFLAVVIAVTICSSKAIASNDYVLSQELDLRAALDTLWVLVSTILVVSMHGGFAMLETGFCQAKNAVNQLSKNVLVLLIAVIAFWAFGFALMFGDGSLVIGTKGFFLDGIDNSPLTGDYYRGVYTSLAEAGIPLEAKFFFQAAFAGTAATIVSGAVAERIKLIDFLLFSFFLVAIAYPVTGHWVWGGGWLQQLGFIDFAGSTVVHSVGGWAALVGTILLGARRAKYNADGSINAIPAHNLSMATLGCFILFVGWFGFNCGSTMSVNASIAHIAVDTLLAASAAGISATAYSWMRYTQPDLTITINGILSGLVAITAGCAYVDYGGAIAIGVVAGILVVLSISFLDRLRIDDPVGAISVHLVNGIWGTLAVGVFAHPEMYDIGPFPGVLFKGELNQLLVQLIGVLAVGVATILFSGIFWLLLKTLFGLRVSKKEEEIGLDLGEHGMEAYNVSRKSSAGR